jgi:hypothetical protein
MKVARPLAFLAFATAVVLAENVRASDELAACETEIGTYCDQVEFGSGRLAACLYAHNPSLSDGCYQAVGDEMDILADVFDVLRYARQECAVDLSSFCSDVPQGQGRLISCLQANADELNDSCAAVITEIPLPAKVP